MNLPIALLTFTITTLTALPRASAADFDPPVRTRVMPVRFYDVELPDAPRERAEAKIIVGGVLPSSCYSDLRTQVESPDERTHVVKAYATKVTNRPCGQDMPAYERQVSLGELAAGPHRLIVQAAGEDYAVRQFTVSR